MDAQLARLTRRKIHLSCVCVTVWLFYDEGVFSSGDEVLCLGSAPMEGFPFGYSSYGYIRVFDSDKVFRSGLCDLFPIAFISGVWFSPLNSRVISLRFL